MPSALPSFASPHHLFITWSTLVAGPTPQQPRQQESQRHTRSRTHTRKSRDRELASRDFLPALIATQASPVSTSSQSHLLPDIQPTPTGTNSLLRFNATPLLFVRPSFEPPFFSIPTDRSPPSEAWNTPRPGVDRNNSTCNNTDQQTIPLLLGHIVFITTPPAHAFSAGRMPSRFGA